MHFEEKFHIVSWYLLWRPRISSSLAYLNLLVDYSAAVNVLVLSDNHGNCSCLTSFLKHVGVGHFLPSTYVSIDIPATNFTIALYLTREIIACDCVSTWGNMRYQECHCHLLDEPNGVLYTVRILFWGYRLGNFKTYIPKYGSKPRTDWIIFQIWNVSLAW